MRVIAKAIADRQSEIERLQAEPSSATTPAFFGKVEGPC